MKLPNMEPNHRTLKEPNPPHSPDSQRPWWKEPYVWMVISGPVGVVIACAITAFYILQGPDALVSENYYQEGIALGQKVSSARPPMQPAQVGRDHSATGGRKNGQP